MTQGQWQMWRTERFFDGSIASRERKEAPSVEAPLFRASEPHMSDLPSTVLHTLATPALAGANPFLAYFNII
jgi:hypothetical protein